ncbi:unnamed protein product [Rodentolepis nana]|uniref:DAGKa domain-containing protein n=1 Tax=Rodentolepis nana TaxID=102285 RepID=A0A0R3T167_RODNA|nr:unnamed protein product [Rodentolepis nana]
MGLPGEINWRDLSAVLIYEVNVYDICNFIIDKLHGEAPPLSNGVIITNVSPPKTKAPGDDPERGTPPPPKSLLAHKIALFNGANNFVGSCAHMSVDQKEGVKARRQTISYFDSSNVIIPMRRLFGSGDIGFTAT